VPGDATGDDDDCDGVDQDCSGTADDNYVPTGCGDGVCARESACVEGEEQACQPGQPTGDDDDCDGVDQDCSGVADDNFVPPTCGRGVCASEGRCQAGFEQPCVPGQATGDDADCDGIDQDCSGAPDDHFVGASCGQGVCASTATCVQGEVQACVEGAPTGDDADCDGVDQDCSGAADDNYVPTTCGQGVCERESACDEGQEEPCEAGLPSGGDNECDGIDQDCDGVPDDGYPPVECGVGACARESACVEGEVQACVPGQPTGDDTDCDGVDQNCDGTADDGFVPGTCGVGACAADEACVTGEVQCTPGDPAPDDPTCDGVDDDCDDATDEDWVPTTCGVGACERDATCVQGEATCTPGEAAAGDYVCDGADEDCDGQPDEDYVPVRCGLGACERESECTEGVESCTPGASSDQPDADCDGEDEDCDGVADEDALLTLRVPEDHGTLQAALDAAGWCARIEAGPGRYVERLTWPNRTGRIELVGTMGAELTIIDGSSGGRTVSMSGSNINQDHVLSGFTVTGGRAPSGGGIAVTSGAAPLIRDCLVAGNSAYQSGGSEPAGGGVLCLDAAPLLVNVWMEGNTVEGEAADGGGFSGLQNCTGTLRNCVLASNRCSGSFAHGAGISSNQGSNVTLENVTIYGNTLSGMFVEGSGIGMLLGGQMRIRSSIIYSNSVYVFQSPNPTATHSRTELQGEGNITDNPRLQADLRLSPDSPCLDAGDPAAPFDQEPHPNGYRVNMGAWGNTPFATASDLPVGWCATLLGGWTNSDDGCKDPLGSDARGLTWGPRLDAATWAAQDGACTASQLGGQQDWRLPTVEELLAAAGPLANDAGRSLANADNLYLASDECAGGGHLLVNLAMAAADQEPACVEADTAAFARCVRAAQ